MFSPNDKYIVTGTSTHPKEEQGRVVIFERDTLKKVHEINVVDSVKYLFFVEKKN
jgi:WD repeat-containing protein 70